MKDYVVLVLGAPGIVAQHKKRLHTKFPYYYSMLKGSLSGYKTSVRRKFPKIYAGVKNILQKLSLPKKRKLSKSRQRFDTTMVLNSKEELLFILKKLKEANTGQSVVVSGLLNEVDLCLKQIDLRPHTVQFSLGRFGRIDHLPSEEILEITTMCGHHLLSPNLVEKLAGDVSDGKISKKEAVQAMGKTCICGIVNEARAEDILNTIVLKTYRKK
jgi:hypothetical protein